MFIQMKGKANFYSGHYGTTTKALAALDGERLGAVKRKWRALEDDLRTFSLSGMAQVRPEIPVTYSNATA